jgi:hypothetical protein
LRKIFRPKRGQRKGEWKKLHNERLYDLYCSQNIHLTKSRMRGARHGIHTGFWWGDLMKRNNVEDLDVDGRVTLKRIFNTWGGEAWTGLLWLKIRTDGGRLCIL